jgi:hypothetical protein
MSSVLSQKIFQHDIIQHGVRQQAFELGVLILKRFQPCSLVLCPLKTGSLEAVVFR